MNNNELIPMCRHMKKITCKIVLWTIYTYSFPWHCPVHDKRITLYMHTCIHINKLSYTSTVRALLEYKSTVFMIIWLSSAVRVYRERYIIHVHLPTYLPSAQPPTLTPKKKTNFISEYPRRSLIWTSELQIIIIIILQCIITVFTQRGGW